MSAEAEERGEVGESVSREVQREGLGVPAFQDLLDGDIIESFIKVQLQFLEENLLRDGDDLVVADGEEGEILG